MAYLNSANISVFPCANRGAEYIASKLTTERNLTNIINSIVTTEGFVLSYVTGGHIEFVLGGYYFEVNNLDVGSTEFASATTIYANIKLAGTNPYLEIQNLAPTDQQDSTLDINGNFYGLSLTKDPAGAGYKSLLILTRATTNAAWQVPETSKIRLISGTGNITVKIDDGEL